MLSEDRLLLETEALEPGFFVLGKVAFVVSGVNVPESERCDNLMVTGMMVSENTPYQGQAYIIGRPSDYSQTILNPMHIKKVEYPIYFSPHFLITYLEVDHLNLNVPQGLIDIQSELSPSTMWGARSIYQLFKNIREWSFMVEDPFSLDHPMATYSKLVLESLNPPQEIIDEIDSMPDMHLAKFLKNQSDYKTIPDHPVISELFKNWILEIAQQYPYRQFEDQI